MRTIWRFERIELNGVDYRGPFDMAFQYNSTAQISTMARTALPRSRLEHLCEALLLHIWVWSKLISHTNTSL